jgi:hypothetical protein
MRDSVHIYAGVPSCGWASMDGPYSVWKIKERASIVTYIHASKWITCTNHYLDLNTWFWAFVTWYMAFDILDASIGIW